MDWECLLCVMLTLSVWSASSHGITSYKSNSDHGNAKKNHLNVLQTSRKRVARTATPPGCGSTVVTLTTAGEIMSPNYPTMYPNFARCRWMITAPRKHRVSLRFTAFSLESSTMCIYDSLAIYDARDASAELMDTLCGAALPANKTSTGRYMYLQFKSDITNVGFGFKAVFTFIKFKYNSSGNTNESTNSHPIRNDMAGCGATLHLVSADQTITSPSDSVEPNFYPNNANCAWTVTAPLGQHVKLTSSKFDIESSAGCTYDFLVVYDGKEEHSGILGRFCGLLFPKNGVVSTGNTLHVVFHSDYMISTSGFKLGLKFVDPKVDGCNRTLGGESGWFASPNFGTANYPDNVLCIWVIEVKDTEHVQLVFNTFNVEVAYGCAYDVVHVYNGPHRKSKLLGSFCGRRKPPVTASTDRHLRVEFMSDQSVGDIGFNASYTALPRKADIHENIGCGAEQPAILKNKSGTIISPTKPPTTDYPNNARCQWKIVVPADERIHVHFNGFLLEASDSCLFDNLEIFDGEKTTDKRLGRFCGTDIPANITTSGNVVLVRFKSDSSETRSGFKIIYTTTKAQQNGIGSNTGTGSNTKPTCGSPDINPNFGRIVGGTEASPYSWPWQISLRLLNFHICGGSLISTQWVLTAAHCVSHGVASQFAVVVGEYDVSVASGDEQIFGVMRIVKHEHYDETTIENDIALIKLAGNVTFSRAASPICLPREDIGTNASCYTTGWGQMQSGNVPNILNQVRVPIIDRALCSQPDWYGSNLKPSMLCAGYPGGGMDSCQGDSGGPLVCLKKGIYRLQGITSWGFGCAQAKNPGVYTRVAAFVDWVNIKTSGAFQSPL